MLLFYTGFAQMLTVFCLQHADNRFAWNDSRQRISPTKDLQMGRKAEMNGEFGAHSCQGFTHVRQMKQKYVTQGRKAAKVFSQIYSLGRRWKEANIFSFFASLYPGNWQMKRLGTAQSVTYNFLLNRIVCITWDPTQRLATSGAEIQNLSSLLRIIEPWRWNLDFSPAIIS